MLPFTNEEVFSASFNIIKDMFSQKIEGDGGSYKLLKVIDNVIYMQLGGSCLGCPSVNVTLKQGIETTLKNKIHPSLIVVNVPLGMEDKLEELNVDR